MSKCTVLAHVRRPDGSVVESRLFKDLLHYSSNRSMAKEYYAVGTSREFLDRVQDDAQFDENGEITFESLKRLTHFDIGKSETLNKLNRDIGAGNVTYREAIGRLQQFNRENPYRSDYMATLVPNNDGQYNLSVVERTPSNEASLEKVIHNQTLQDRLIYYLNRAGVAVDFLEEGNKVGGRYSTVNAQQSSDGLYHLIQVARGKHLDSRLAEEAGHFAVGALGNSPLVQRLTSLLTPEVQKEVLGEDYNNKVLGNNPRREVAGTLVGQALEGNLEEKTSWQKLAHRIATLAKRVFASISGDEVMKATIEAKEIARQIAQGFISPEFSGTVENALSTTETLYNAPSSFNVRVYRKVVSRLSKHAAELRNIANDSFANKFQLVLGQVESGRNSLVNSPSIFADQVALEGIAEAVAAFADMLGQGKEIDTMLKSVDFDNTADFYSSMAENGRKLRQVHTFLRNGVALEKLLDDAITSLTGKESLTGDITNITLTDQGRTIVVNLKDMLSELETANRQLQKELYTKEFQFFARFCEDSLGSKYVRTSTRVLFSKNGKLGIRIAEGGKVEVADVLNSLEDDIDFFERYLGSMSNNPDIIGQIVDKTTKMANKMADDLTNQCQDELRVLQERLHKLGIKDTSLLFERSDRTGKLTGNIISDLNWGDWESDWEEFKQAELEAFKANTPNLDTMTEFEKGVQWDMWFRPKAKAWHKTNSTFDVIQSRYVPNDNLYYNTEFNYIMSQHPGLKEWYNDYMRLKLSLDERLPEGSTMPMRAPQFKGTFVNKVQNRRLFESRGKALKHTLRSQFMDTFCESSEDQDFGSMNTYNSEEEELFGNALAYEKEKMHRLPLFGINKLKDMGDLSTDLFHTTLAYASMANSHAALSQIVDTLEVGSEVLNRRKVAGIESEGENKGNKSKAYNRYLKFLDKQVYGISMKRHKLGPLVWEKLTGALSGLASKMFLGGNVVGGMVNTGTGIIEVLKEMGTGEYYNFEDFKKANEMYFSSFVDNWMDYGSESKDNKTSLFIRHFNMLGDNRTGQKGWKTRHSRIYNMFSQSLFLPYKSGDHWMQSISYLSLGNHIKLYDERGNKISLLNAYEIVDNEDEYGRKGGKTLKLKGTFFKSKDGKAEYDMIQSILTQINNAASSNSLFGRVINLTQEEQDYLAKKGYNLADTDNTRKSLEEDAYRLTWQVDDESAFMDKAREISNRLHGIYNNQDKVAFSQSWYGNAVLAMRGWALGMAERRFASNHYSIALGRDVEGSLTTLAKTIASTFTDKGGFSLTARAILLPFGKNTARAYMQAGFSANQFRNLKRNFFDCLFIALLTMLKAAASQPPKEERDEEYEPNVAEGLLYYFANRLYREQSALNTPTGWYYEYTTLLDILPVGFSALKDLYDLSYKFVGAQVADESNSDFFYQESKEGRYEQGDPKWENHFFRLFPYLKSRYTFEHPYEASESFEYGRNVKQR